MNTMTLVHTTEKADDLLTMTDAELEDWFADAGLEAAAVTQCDTAACPTCFPTLHRTTRAA